MLDINLQTINGTSTSLATHESLISRTQKNIELKKMKFQSPESNSSRRTYFFWHPYQNVNFFFFQYHVVGGAHDNYNACEYWHLLWFEFAVLFYLRNSSPDMKKSYKALFHTWHDRDTFSLGITWNWLTTVKVNQLLRMCIILLPCRMNYVWLDRPTFKIHKLCK